MHHRTRIGVVRGGPSNEYEVSLQTGASVLHALREKLIDKYEAKDLFIDREGYWYVDGVLCDPVEILNKIDVVFNALHGPYGEDGRIQTFFETHGKPFTGSGSLGSAIGMNKVLSKKVFKDHGIKTPHHRIVEKKDIEKNIDGVVRNLFHSFLLPAIVKPASSGSSVGVSIVHYYKEFPEALKKAAIHDNVILIEEFVKGIEATCAVLDHFRNEELYALPPVEIRSHNNIFDYEAKYSGKSEEIVPATFSHKIKEEIAEMSRIIHRALGLRHYSRSDFIIHPRRGIYALEVNTLPGLTKESLLPKSLRAVGSDVHEFVDHIIQLAHGR